MANRLGGEALQRLKLVDTHIPERAVEFEPVFAHQPPDALGSMGTPVSSLPRPLRLLPRPEPIEVAMAEVPDGPPRAMIWRRVRYSFPRAQGAERIAAEWWHDAASPLSTRRAPAPPPETPLVLPVFNADAITRDYFIAEDDGGRRFWLFREGLYVKGREPELVPARVFCMNKVLDINNRRARAIAQKPAPPLDAPPYAELLATSNFSFLRSGSDPEELVASAIANGLSGLGIADRNSFAGVVRGLTTLRQLAASEEIGPRARAFRYVVGVRLVFADRTPDIIAYPTDRDAYGRLCQLLTLGNTREVNGKRAEKAICTLNFADLAPFADGQLFILEADETDWQNSRTPSMP